MEQTCLLGRGCWNLDLVYSTGLEIPEQKVRLTSFADWISVWGSRNDDVGVLVATNVAAHRLDIPEVDLVVQSSPPKDVES